MIAVKLCQPDCGRSFEHAERDPFVAQSDDAKGRACSKTHEVPRVNLDFEQAAFAGGDCVAFD